MTFRRMTFRRMTFRRMTFRRMKFRRMTFRRMTLGRMAFRRMTFRIMTFCHSKRLGGTVNKNVKIMFIISSVFQRSVILLNAVAPLDVPLGEYYNKDKARVGIQ
jgi:hypothetical protein